MKRLLHRISIVLLLASGFLAQAGLTPTGLRTEHLTDPVGVDEPAPRLSWRVESPERGQHQTAWRVLVATSADRLKRDEGDLWDSGKTAGNPDNQVFYAGERLLSGMRCHWKVQVWDRNDRSSAWSRAATWVQGRMRTDEWQAAFISPRDGTPLHADPASLHLPPARFFRKEFTTRKPVRSALVYATALGIYELHLNGRPVSDGRFAPGWTDYRRRAYYQVHDVTALLRQGPNALGAILADGWYAGYVGYGLLVGYGPHKTGRDIYGKTPALLVQLEIEYEDGTREVTVTDPTWKVTADGPFREADLLMGERYDARQELKDWAKPGFNDQDWESAVSASENGSVKAPFHDAGGVREQEFGFIRPARLQAYPCEPVRAIEELKPVAITSLTNGVYIVNLGQNFAGTVRLKVTGPKGTEIRLRYGEMLHPDGRLMTENLRKARATDTYILRGSPAGETYTPRFTFHGFQYVEITGFPGRPTRDNLTGIVLHSDTPLASDFECSDPMVNRLFRNIVWTQRANFLELPTDCPQRDEREGWMGDAQIYARAATYNADVAAFFTKWLREVEEAQLPSGAYPDYCPWPFQHGKAFATAWTDAGIICPWTIWQVYGDTRLVERQYESMTRFMNWRKNTATDFLGIQHPDGNTWGDWLNLNEATPLDYIDTVYFAATSGMMADMAAAIGRTNDATAYRELFGNIKAAFGKKFLQPDGTLTVDTQSAYAMALSFDLIPENQRAAAGARLAQKIRANETRMATGFLGTRPLLPALSATGQHDLAAQLLQSRRFPSWGFEVENGATTIWERWDSYTRQDGFGKHNAAMNSFSHYSFGAVCEWMFRTLAGIDTEGPAYKHIVLRPGPPTPGSNPDQTPVNWVKARYDSPQGRITTDWALRKSRFSLNVTIPANTRATLHLPATDPDSVREGGRKTEGAAGVRFVRMEGDRAVFELESGSYRFTSTWK